MCIAAPRSPPCYHGAAWNRQPERTHAHGPTLLYDPSLDRKALDRLARELADILAVFADHRPVVNGGFETLRRGELDDLEVVGRVEETRFFRYMLEGGNLERLAAACRMAGLSHTDRQRDSPFYSGTRVIREGGETDLGGFPSTKFSLAVNQIVFVLMASSLLQLFLLQSDRRELARATRERLPAELLPEGERVAALRENHVGSFSVVEYSQILLYLEEEAARRRVAGTIKRLRTSQLEPPGLPEGPTL